MGPFSTFSRQTNHRTSSKFGSVKALLQTAFDAGESDEDESGLTHLMVKVGLPVRVTTTHILLHLLTPRTDIPGLEWSVDHHWSLKKRIE